MIPFPSIYTLKTCRHGKMLYNPRDLFIGRSFEVYGEFSQGESDLFQSIVQPGQLILEIGANIGSHTIYLSQLVGPTGRVLAFEPQRVLFQNLCANLALNSLTNVWSIQAAVGAEPGELLVPFLDYSQGNNFGALELGGYAHGDPVPVITIDGLNLTHCMFIKIDVEGMEESVLRGGAQTLERLKPVLYVENDRPNRSVSLIRYLDSLGYNLYWHLPQFFNPANFFNNPHNVFGTMCSVNMLGIHQSVPQQLTGFERVEVPAGDREVSGSDEGRP